MRELRVHLSKLKDILGQAIMRLSRAGWPLYSPKITVNQAVAFLGLVLSASVFLLAVRYGVPERIAFGSAILCVLVVSIFWTAVNLGDDDEDDH